MAELFHIGVTVKNLERSIAFSRDIVEMQADEYPEVQSEAFDRLTNNPGAPLKVIDMKADPVLLQLIEYVAAGGPTLDLHHNNAGSPHISLYVAAVEDKDRQRKSRGDVTITSDIVQIAPNMRSFYTEDPDAGCRSSFCSRQTKGKAPTRRGKPYDTAASPRTSPAA